MAFPIIPVMMAVSAVVAAAGTVYAGNAQKAAADYNASLEEEKAKALEAEAREAIRRRRAENEAFLSRQLAIRAKSGVSIEEGSSLLVAAESAARLELEALEFGREQQSRAEALKSNARGMRYAGSQALRASYIDAGTSLLAGGYSAYNAYDPVGSTYLDVNLNKKYTKKATTIKNSDPFAYSIIDPTRNV